MTSLVVTSWIAPFGTSVFSRAVEITFDIATNDSVDSFPPVTKLERVGLRCGILTFENGCVAGFNGE